MHVKANIIWVHKTIAELIKLDEYPLLATLKHISDSEILEIIREHTHESLRDADVELRTNVINEIANLDWERRMDRTIKEIATYQEEYACADELVDNEGGDTYGLRIHIVCEGESRRCLESV